MKDRGSQVGAAPTQEYLESRLSMLSRLELFCPCGRGFQGPVGCQSLEPSVAPWTLLPLNHS